MSTATMNSNSVQDELNWQFDQIRTGAYEKLGHIWKVVIEAAAGAAVPEAEVTQQVGVCLDWYGMENYRGRNLLPLVAQTKDRGSLLMLDAIVRPDGAVGLPDIPDPNWIPRPPTQEELTTVVPLQAAPMLQQSLHQRARGVLKGTNYLVFGPVAQVLIRPVRDGRMLSEAWILVCRADPATGKQMDMLIDQETGQACFYGGTFQISIPG